MYEYVYVFVNWKHIGTLVQFVHKYLIRNDNFLGKRTMFNWKVSRLRFMQCSGFNCKWTQCWHFRHYEAMDFMHVLYFQIALTLEVFYFSKHHPTWINNFQFQCSRNHIDVRITIKKQWLFTDLLESGDQKMYLKDFQSSLKMALVVWLG